MTAARDAMPAESARRVPFPRAWHALLGAVIVATPVAADTEADTLLGSGCTGCHGSGGVTAGEGIPSIAGLDKVYFARVMVQFKNHERPSTIMGRLAKGYTDSELRTLAKQFGSRPWTAWRGVAAQAEVEAGRELHDRLCAECHEQEGRHQDRDTPRIAGQAPQYLLLSMQQYRDGQDAQRLPQPDKMLKALRPLMDDQLLSLSRYYASRR